MQPTTFIPVKCCCCFYCYYHYAPLLFILLLLYLYWVFHVTTHCTTNTNTAVGRCHHSFYYTSDFCWQECISSSAVPPVPPCPTPHFERKPFCRKKLDPELAECDHFLAALPTISGWPSSVVDFLRLCRAPPDEVIFFGFGCRNFRFSSLPALFFINTVLVVLKYLNGTWWYFRASSADVKTLNIKIRNKEHTHTHTT